MTFSVVVRGADPTLLERAAEAVEELLREVQTSTGSDHPAAGSAVELGRLVDRIYAAQDGRQQLLEAFRSGSDVDMELPDGVEDDLVELGLLLDRLDEHARRGELLALPREPDVRAVNWWALTEVVRQRHGLAPTAFG